MPVEHGEREAASVRHRSKGRSSYLGSLDVAQECVAQAAVLVGAVDEARQVSDREASKGVGHVHDAEDRMQRREGIGSDLGRGLRDGAQQGALAGVGISDQADVGDHAQLELDHLVLAEAALGSQHDRRVGRAIARLGPMQRRVALAAIAATSQQQRVGRATEVGEHERLADLAGHWQQLDDRTARHRDDGVGTSATLLVLASTGPSVAGLEVVRLQADEALAIAHAHDDAAASSAIAAVGRSSWREAIAMERHDAVAAIACSRHRAYLVDEGFLQCTRATTRSHTRAHDDERVIQVVRSLVRWRRTA